MIECRSTICPYCSCGCGINLVLKDGKIIGQEPMKEHPVNEGTNCPKGRNAYQFLYSQERLKKPLIRKDGELKETSWDEALNKIAESLDDTNPGDFGLLASGKNTNEEAYVLQKFARIVMGTNNVEYCGRLCHSPTSAGLGPTVGSGVMPISEIDVEKSDCIILAGVNLKETFPMLTMRVIKAKEKGAKIIVIDPRKTSTARYLGDLHLQLNPSTDVALLNAMMEIILKEGLEDSEFIEKRTTGIENLRQHLSSIDIEEMEHISNVSIEKIKEAAISFAKSNTGCIIFNQGVNQHVTGTDNVKAIATLALLTGQYGRPGTGACPTRGQINGEGVGEMGCLTAFYPGFKRVSEEVAHEFEQLWNVKNLPSEIGYKYTEIIEETDFLYIIGTNPMISAPDVGNVRKNLQNKELLIVQDIFPTETAQLADFVLPAATWVERDGVHAYVDRRVQKINKIVDPPGEAKPDWLIACEIAEKMGYNEYFDYDSPSEILDEIGSVFPSYAGINYKRLEETPGGIQWPCPEKDHPGTETFYTNGFNTPDGLGHLQVVRYKQPSESSDDEYKYNLTTGRNIFHYHTGSMSRRTPKLDEEVPEAYVQINKSDAENEGVKNGDTVTLESRRGSIDVKANVTDDVPRGLLFVPFHFAEACANILTNPTLDPDSGMPEYKICSVKLGV
ncbi:MAG: formate dehydrogenase subunit alpha [Thermoplasmatota archaeon]